MLELTDAEGEQDVHDAANHGKGRNPGDEQNGAAPVEAGRPETQGELDDPSDQLQPPHLDLVSDGNRLDDVERPSEDEQEAEYRGQRQKVSPG